SERAPAGATLEGRRRPGGRPTTLPATVAGVFADYEDHVARPRGPLDANTIRVYTSRLRQYLASLAAALHDRTVERDPPTAPAAGDVHLPTRNNSARNAHLRVRSGKSGKHREIPLHPKLRTVLQEWLSERASWKGAEDNPALYLNHRGGRLSARSAYTVLRAI